MVHCDRTYLYIACEDRQVLGVLFPSFFTGFSPPPSKKTDKRKRTETGTGTEALEEKIIYFLFVEALTRARATSTRCCLRHREREKENPRATFLAEAVGREDHFLFWLFFAERRR